MKIENAISKAENHYIELLTPVIITGVILYSRVLVETSCKQILLSAKADFIQLFEYLPLIYTSIVH